MKSLLLLLCFFLTSCEKQKLSWGFAIEGYPITEEMLNHLEMETHISPQLILFYLAWPSNPTFKEKVTSSLENIAKKGAIPCLTWEPMYQEKDQEIAISYKKILDGTYDAYLDDVAEQIRAFKKLVIIRFAQEMNLERYHWGTSKKEYGPESGKIYQKMFQYVVLFFRQKNVENVQWAFCPNAESIPQAAWNRASLYYPGDSFVDLLGMDGYNWDITPEVALEKKYNWISPFRSFKQIFQPLYEELQQIAPNKPIYVFETATVDRKGGQKSRWIQDARQTAKAWGLKGIIWFQVNKEEDWRLTLIQPKVN